KRLRACDLAREARRISCIDDFGNVLVGVWSFLCDPAHRRTSNLDAPIGELVDELATFPGTSRLAPTHGAAGSVTRRAERARLRFGRASKDIRARFHRAADQHGLAKRTQRVGDLRMTWSECAGRALSVNVQRSHRPIDSML